LYRVLLGILARRAPRHFPQIVFVCNVGMYAAAAAMSYGVGCCVPETGLRAAMRMLPLGFLAFSALSVLALLQGRLRSPSTVAATSPR
jgi:hypothetical protein